MAYYENDDTFLKYKDYVLMHKDKKETLKQDIEKILGEDYEELYSFFLRNISADSGNDFVILMSRRCLVLCQIFLDIFILEEEELGDGPCVISDKGIYKYRKAMEGKRVCILDDILIHGRTISRVFDEICEYTKKEPEVSVFVMNFPIDCLKEPVRGHINFEYEYSPAKWRTLSDKIVNCIYGAAAPYTSYVTSFTSFSALPLIDRLRGKEELVFENIGDDFQKKFDLECYCCYEKESAEYSVFRTLCLEQCIRFYVNRRNKKVLAIPYVFIKSCNRTQLDQLLEKFSGYLPEGMSSIRADLSHIEKDKRETEKAIEYKLMLLTCILSKLYWEYFKNKYSLESDWFMDTDTVTKSFGHMASKELEQIAYTGQRQLLDFNCSDSFFSASYGDECTRSLSDELSQSYDKEIEEPNRILKNYFQKTWWLDEQRAKKNESRLPGLPVESFLKAKAPFEKTDRKIYSALISAWDTGIAASKCTVSFDKKSIGCYTVPGEQSYRIVLEKYPFIMKSLIFISRNIRAKKLGVKSQEEFAERRVKILQELVSQFEERFGIQLKEIKQIIEEEKGKLDAWNNTVIFRECLERDEYKDDELVRNYLQQINT